MAWTFRLTLQLATHSACLTKAWYIICRSLWLRTFTSKLHSLSLYYCWGFHFKWATVLNNGSFLLGTHTYSMTLLHCLIKNNCSAIPTANSISHRLHPPSYSLGNSSLQSLFHIHPLWWSKMWGVQAVKCPLPLCRWAMVQVPGELYFYWVVFGPLFL